MEFRLPALADAAYGDNYDFREGITELGLCGTWSASGNVRPSGNRENPSCPRNNRKGRGAPARERDYEELKQELGLGHYEGHGWRGFHHHATVCIAAYGFLVMERSRFSPTVRADRLELRTAKLPSEFKPRGSPRPRRTS